MKQILKKALSLSACAMLGAMQALADEMGCSFVDVNGRISDAEGYLRPEYAADAIHLTPDGYFALLQELVRYFSADVHAGLCLR